MSSMFPGLYGPVSSSSTTTTTTTVRPGWRGRWDNLRTDLTRDWTAVRAYPRNKWPKAILLGVVILLAAVFLWRFLWWLVQSLWGLTIGRPLPSSPAQIEPVVYGDLFKIIGFGLLILALVMLLFVALGRRAAGRGFWFVVILAVLFVPVFLRLHWTFPLYSTIANLAGIGLIIWALVRCFQALAAVARDDKPARRIYFRKALKCFLIGIILLAIPFAGAGATNYVGSSWHGVKVKDVNVAGTPRATGVVCPGQKSGNSSPQACSDMLYNSADALRTYPMITNSMCAELKAMVADGSYRNLSVESRKHLDMLSDYCNDRLVRAHDQAEKTLRNICSARLSLPNAASRGENDPCYTKQSK